MRLNNIAYLLALVVSAAAAQDQNVGPCQPAQVRISNTVGAATGNLNIELTLTNISEAPCILAGSPRVLAINAAGEPIAAEVRWPASSEGFEKGVETIAVNPKGQVRFVIHTLDRTAFAKSDECSDVLRVYLPSSPADHPVARIEAQSCREIEVSGYKTLE